MSADKYPSILSRQMEAIVYISDRCPALVVAVRFDFDFASWKSKLEALNLKDLDPGSTKEKY